MGRIEGKIALVTGGAGGIGSAIARRFLEEGARVAITDLSATNGSQAREALSAVGDVAFFEHDVTSETSWAEVVAATVAHFGRLDVLVNNAGIALPPPPSFEEITLADWKKVQDVNLNGTFLGTREAVRAMKSTGGGSIINMGSVAAFVGTPGGAGYGSSKGGVMSLTRQAAVACARKGYNIRVNAIHPCYVWTPLVAARANAAFGPEKAQDGLRALHPFKCLAEPIDIANFALFLASDESRLINAADLLIDGGLLAAGPI